MRRHLALALLVTATALAAGCPGGEEDLAPDDTVVADADAAAGEVDAVADEGTPADPRCCPVGVCPLGEICLDGACHPAAGSGGCYVDGECAAGQRCEGSTRCGCGDLSCQPVVGTCRWPEGCCNLDADCAAGEVCHEGVCRTPPPDGACWVDGHCKAGEVCEDVGSCPCGDGGCAATPGRCSLPGVCCLTDAECGAGGRCVGARCVPDPPPGRCFDASDCSGTASCAGAYVCPCGDASCLVPTTAGVCTASATCCQDSGDCPETAVCVDGKACAKAPGGDKCYLDDHCGPGRVCEGATVCTCGELCPTGASKAGTCRTVTAFCKSDEGCEPGMRCVVPDRLDCPDSAAAPQGVCVQEVDGGCWSSDDCGPNKRCGGERVCINPAGCAEANEPGTCRAYVKSGDCCDSHRDCAPSDDCRNSNTTLTCPPTGTAVCLPRPQFGERCWNYLDCPAGLVCNQAFVCACNARCGKSYDGWCGSPAGQACKTNVDCGAGYRCARDEECIVNPCINSDDCPVSGFCKPVVEGACWSHTECGADAYCQGLRVCPTDDECNEPDEPGTCTPLGAAGDCCDSYHGCSAGLRCISSVTKTGCNLDFSSVCVPFTPFNQTCFTDEDCAESRKCVGASICPCGVQGCDTPPKPGTCELK